jgi:4'-phosphopantetheinyl transferase
MLSQDELARVRSIHSELGKRRFISSRGILRSILARYLEVSPGEVSFRYGSYGKPFLAKSFENAGMEFSLSHSRDSMILGVTLEQRIGVDAEYSTRLPETQAIARKFFSSEESELIQSSVGDARDEAFFRIWTGKEAVLKANGLGLTQRLSEIAIPCQRTEPNHFVRLAHTEMQGMSLSLSYLEPVSGLTVALVAERANSRLKGWRRA